jgi:hypothetical protein
MVPEKRQKEPVTDKQRPMRSVNDQEAFSFDRLAGKNTLLRKKQLRKLVEERNAHHQNDLFGDEDEPTPEKPKRKLRSGDTPEVLKPFDQDGVDNYIAGIKKRKLVQSKSATIASTAGGKKKKQKVMVKPAGPKSKKAHGPLVLLEDSTDDSNGDDDEEEDDVSGDDGNREFAIDLYAAED